MFLKRFELDIQRGRKLEERWEGSFIFTDVSHHGLSGRLRDVTTGRIVRVKTSGLKERCHVNDLRVYVPRDVSSSGPALGMSLSEVQWNETREKISIIRSSGGEFNVGY